MYVIIRTDCVKLQFIGKLAGGGKNYFTSSSIRDAMIFGDPENAKLYVEKIPNTAVAKVTVEAIK